MSLFQNLLWGYQLSCPAHWVHTSAPGADIFAPQPGQTQTDASDTPETETGQVVVRCEWNWARQPIEPLWNRHIGLLAGMLGAKEVGSAPWRIGDALGLEAEIVLPKKDNRRLWTGVLMRDFRVLHFVATHPKQARASFEPAATSLVASLRFPAQMNGLETSPDGLPLPPGYLPADPASLLNDIPDPQQWRAYTGQASMGALQAFYLRELPAHQWKLEEYVPFPSPDGPGFARFQVRKEQLRITLGLMPYETGEADTGFHPGRIVYKLRLL